MILKMRFSTLADITLAGILLTSVLLIGSTTGQGVYDPWADINDDGYIELTDFFIPSQHFGAEGTPLTEAALEYGTEMWNHTYGGTNSDVAWSVVQTSDGGYAIAGETWSYGAGDYDFWLVKTDSSGNHQWNKTYGGTNYEIARSVVQTSDGGYAIAGNTASYGAGLNDFWLVKTDASGNAEWTHTYGGTDYEDAYSVVQTSDGGYAIAGSTYSYGAGDYDFWLVKTYADGDAEWTHTYGGTNGDFAYSVVQTSDGGYAIAGSTYSYGVGTPAPNFWLVKTYADGDAEWTHTYGGTNSDVAWSVVQTSDGGYAIAGKTRSYGAGDYDFWLVKTYADGDAEWNHTYGGTDSDVAWSVVQTSDGGYAMAGYTDSYGAGFSDFWLVKTYASGDAEWNHTYGGTHSDFAFSVVQTSDGGYAIAGETYSYGAGLEDFWLVKTDSKGNVHPESHDVAVTNVATSKTGCSPIPTVGQGYTVRINVTVENQGTITENFNVNASVLLPPTPGQWNAFWAMGDVNRDGYIDQADVDLISLWFGASVPPAPPECDLNGDGEIDMYDLIIVTSNYGLDIWTYFGLRVQIGTQNIILPNGESETLTFTWDTTGFALGNYTISATADILPEETDTEDNTFVDGWVLIARAGDINADSFVNAKDAILLGNAFYPDGAYNPNADINDDDFCNAKDAIIIGTNFDT